MYPEDQLIPQAGAALGGLNLANRNDAQFAAGKQGVAEILEASICRLEELCERLGGINTRLVGPRPEPGSTGANAIQPPPNLMERAHRINALSSRALAQAVEITTAL